MTKIAVLDHTNPQQLFPPLSHALSEPNGLLAVGGCLSTQRLLNAYRNGIFPWFSREDPILWWSPNPRLILLPHELHISRRLAKLLRQNKFHVTFNQAFEQVITCCAAVRIDMQGTWITKEMHEAYVALHHEGFAQSVETWFENKLVGGFYGVKIGNVFFGESMFHTQTDASKVAFAQGIKHFQGQGIALIDCQVHSAHLISLGAKEISRDTFLQLLSVLC
jgi:leucyl/phenylalanyl-tRNA--protein transferase